MSQQSVPGGTAVGAGRSSSTAQGACRPGKDRLGRLAVAMLAALSERDAERRAGEEPQTMTDDTDCRCANRSTGAALVHPGKTLRQAYRGRR